MAIGVHRSARAYTHTDYQRPQGSGTRPRLYDVLMQHNFWAFDAASPLAFPVFTPLFGFSRISSPSIQADVESFRDGTFMYNRNVIKGATVGTVTFERAATLFDSDFYDWLMWGINGEKFLPTIGPALPRLGGLIGSSGMRRDIVIVQFAAINPASVHGLEAIAAIGGAAMALEAGGLAASPLVAAGVSAVGGVGPFEFAARLPGRLWKLYGCIPVSYQAASEFDASTAGVSLMSIEVQPEWIEEESLGLKP